MNNAFATLLSISSDELLPVWESDALERLQSIPDALLDILRCKNGFFAFESALHVYPLGDSQSGMDLIRWNEMMNWRYEYGDLIDNRVLFFAQDAFGNQFAIRDDAVVLFYAEFAEVEPVAKNLDEWSHVLMSDWRGFSGYNLAHEWQIQNRPLMEGERLIPKIPFVIGGKYEVGNLYAGRVVDAMKFRGSLARQIVSLSDGTRINLNITKE